jgi:predicted branched-subunit amino acid permease
MLDEALPRPAPESVGVGRAGLLAGVRAGFPFAIAGCILAVSFGVVAQDIGMSKAAAIIMSTIVFAGSAQFAALAIVGGGGAIGAAIVAAALMNSRFLAMSIALAPSLPGGPLWRALQGQTTVDASWAIASRGDGTFDRALLFGSTAIQYVAWVGGTVIGAFGGGALGDTDRFGLDAVYPAFFAGLLIKELHDPRSRAVAAAGGLIALVLVPIAPAGVPILAASLAALAGLTRQARADTAAVLRKEHGS